MALAEKPRAVLVKEVTPQYKVFEGIQIQCNKVPWNFEHSTLGSISIDTYSIWNIAHHAEIATRLANGERAAVYMMGNFGVVEVRRGRKERVHDPIFDDIKQRDKTQTLVIFAHPDDIHDFIDFERLPDAFGEFQIPKKRREIYPGPMHIILPVKTDKIPDLGLVREEREAAFFWIPGHFGYEALSKKVKVKGGLLAGGSLNIHGQEPSYTKEELKDQFSKLEQWQENINFVILDEISEAEGIGRSHTQVSFMQDPAQVIRIGSITAEKISRHTGYVLSSNEKVNRASSTTPYDDLHNLEIERKVESALSRIARYQASCSRNEAA